MQTHTATEVITKPVKVPASSFVRLMPGGSGVAVRTRDLPPAPSAPVGVGQSSSHSVRLGESACSYASDQWAYSSLAPGLNSSRMRKKIGRRRRTV